MLEVLSPGADRVVAPCPHFGACGGCRFQDYAYEHQLEAKEGQVRENSSSAESHPDHCFHRRTRSNANIR